MSSISPTDPSLLLYVHLNTKPKSAARKVYSIPYVLYWIVRRFFLELLLQLCGVHFTCRYIVSCRDNTYRDYLTMTIYLFTRRSVWYKPFIIKTALLFDVAKKKKHICFFVSNPFIFLNIYTCLSFLPCNKWFDRISTCDRNVLPVFFYNLFTILGNCIISFLTVIMIVIMICSSLWPWCRNLTLETIHTYRSCRRFFLEK